MPFHSCARWCVAGLLAAGLLGTVGLAAAEGPAQELPKAPEAPAETAPEPRPADNGAPSRALVGTILHGPEQPIDLGSALRLAGVENPEILIARQRVTLAVAERQLAVAQILPSFNVGGNLDHHTGNLQQSNGTILQVNRDALYLGLGSNAVAAGSVNIPGFVYAGNLSANIYDALVRRQRVRQAQFESVAVRNQVLLRVADAYLELLRAEGRRAIALRNRADAARVARVTAERAQKGIKFGRKADADRAATELQVRNAEVTQAEEDLLVASARLAELLNLDPSVRLRAVDGWVVPAPIVPDPIPLPELLAIAITRRPELAARQAAIRAAMLDLASAKVLPFSPTYIVGWSAGTFGGGSNLVSQGIRQSDGTILQQPRFDSFDGRQDMDAIFYWTARNLGVGNLAMIKLARANLRIEDLRRIEVLDRVRTEVAAAYARTHARWAQIETAERAVRSGQAAFEEDYNRTFSGVGLPIETLDSLRLLARSRNAYLDAVVDYNRAQFELFVALGQPPADVLARPVPADLVPPPQPCPPGPPPGPAPPAAPNAAPPPQPALPGRKL